jgi:two-component system, cell cycle sensor histidine kinase and response regulator CckA
MSEERSGAILIVDDDEAMRAAMGRILAGRGRPVVAVATAGAAIEISDADDPPVALVIADLSVTGSDFGRRIAQTRPGIAVVYVSGLSRSAAQRRGLIGTDEPLVVKPFTATHLRTVVSAALHET